MRVRKRRTMYVNPEVWIQVADDFDGCIYEGSQDAIISKIAELTSEGVKRVLIVTVNPE